MRHRGSLEDQKILKIEINPFVQKYQDDKTMKKNKNKIASESKMPRNAIKIESFENNVD